LFNDEIRFEYEYDDSGRLAIFKDIYNTNIYFYSYDLAGRLKQVTDKDENIISYIYDDNGNLYHYNYKISGFTRNISYIYNSNDGTYQFANYQVSSTDIKKEYNYSSDALKRINSVDLLLGTTKLSKVFAYDDSLVIYGNATTRIYSVQYQKNDISYKTYVYTYDSQNNIVKIEIKTSGVTTEQYDYIYDGFNQLRRENAYQASMSGLNYTKTYSYNQNGNITSIKKYQLTYQPNLPSCALEEQIISYTNNWKDQMSRVDYFVEGDWEYYHSFSYDALGNVSSSYNRTYLWEGQSLQRITNTSGAYTTYKYNNQKIRTQKTYFNGTTSIITDYALDGDIVLAEISNADSIYYTYDTDGSLLSMNLNGVEYFYITNLQKDVIELVDINGNTVVTYKYDAWGNITYQTNNVLASKNPYRYRSYRYDQEAGLYYCNTRRFI
jgi:uncharacterized protein RhaS with RHS repeats